MAKRRLGRDLSALLENRTSAIPQEDVIVPEAPADEIPVDSITPNRFQPRESVL